MNLQIQFPAHTSERTTEGSAHAEKNAAGFSKGCKALLKFWQRPSGRFWISNEDGRSLGISSYTSARIWDLIRLGVPIEKKMDGNIKRFRLKCTCRVIGGQDVTTGCYVHSIELKVE